MDEDQMRPFMCGVCQERFSRLGVYLLHVKSHSGLSDKTVHMCNISSLDKLIDTIIDTPYQCRLCYKQFSSICFLHDHIVESSGDGSYVFDHSSNTAYPLSMHCMGYESREVTLDESSSRTKSDDSVCVDDVFKSNANDDSTLVKINEFLNIFVTKPGSGQGKLNTRVSKRGRKPKKLNENEIYNLSKKKKKCTSYTDLSKKTNGQTKVKPMKISTKKAKKSSSKTKQSNTNRSPTTKCGDMSKNDLDDEGKYSDDELYSKDDGTAHSSYNTDSIESTENDLEQLSAKTETIIEDITDSTDQSEPVSLDSNEMDTSDLSGDLSQNNNSIKLEVIEKNGGKQMSGLSSKPNAKGKRKYQKSSVEECPHCCKIMPSYKLKLHMVSHRTERPFQCDKCPKAYKYRNHLVYHKAVHMDVKPFYCEVCGKGMATLNVLKQHVMVHPSDTKPHCCDTCGASFISNYKLNRHMRTHTGIKTVQCDLCGMAFSTQYNLSVHIRGVHKRDHRFSCSQCDKHFMTNYQLKVHLMKHSGERPYKCGVCKADYVERKELRRHLKKQHNLTMDKDCTDTISPVPQADSSLPHVFQEQISKYSNDEKSDTPSTLNMIIAGNSNFISLPSIDINQGDMYSEKTDENSALKYKLFQSKQLRMNSSDVQDFPTSEVMIPGVPLTVTSMNSSFLPLIMDHENEGRENTKMSYEPEVITIGK